MLGWTIRMRFTLYACTPIHIHLPTSTLIVHNLFTFSLLLGLGASYVVACACAFFSFFLCLLYNFSSVSRCTEMAASLGWGSCGQEKEVIIVYSWLWNPLPRQLTDKMCPSAHPVLKLFQEFVQTWIPLSDMAVWAIRCLILVVLTWPPFLRHAIFVTTTRRR